MVRGGFGEERDVAEGWVLFEKGGRRRDRTDRTEKLRDRWVHERKVRMRAFSIRKGRKKCHLLGVEDCT